MGAGGGFGDLIARLRWETEGEEVVDKAIDDMDELAAATDDVGSAANRSNSSFGSMAAGLTKVLGAAAALTAGLKAVVEIQEEIERRARSSSEGIFGTQEIAASLGTDLVQADVFSQRAASVGLESFDAAQIGVIAREELLTDPERITRLFPESDRAGFDAGGFSRRLLGESNLELIDHVVTAVERIHPDQRASVLAASGFGDQEVQAILRFGAARSQASQYQLQEREGTLIPEDALARTIAFTEGQLQVERQTRSGELGALDAQTTDTPWYGLIGPALTGTVRAATTLPADLFQSLQSGDLNLDATEAAYFGSDPRRNYSFLPGAQNRLGETRDNYRRVVIDVNVRQGEIRAEAGDDQSLGLADPRQGSQGWAG